MKTLWPIGNMKDSAGIIFRVIRMHIIPNIRSICATQWKLWENVYLVSIDSTIHFQPSICSNNPKAKNIQPLTVFSSRETSSDG